MTKTVTQSRSEQANARSYESTNRPERYSEAMPVYEPKMRDQTRPEIIALKQQRDNDLNKLEKAAV